MPEDPTQGQEPAAAATGTQGGTDSEPFDKERALATIHKLRENEKAAKLQLKELEELRTKVKTAEDATLSETERLKKEASESTARAERLETQLRESRVTSAVMVASIKLNVVDPEVAGRLLDPSKLEFDEHGAPTNIEALLKALLEAKPYLQGQANGTTTTNRTTTTPAPKPAGAPSMADQVKERIEQLKGTGMYGHVG